MHITENMDSSDGETICANTPSMAASFEHKSNFEQAEQTPGRTSNFVIPVSYF